MCSYTAVHERAPAVLIAPRRSPLPCSISYWRPLYHCTTVHLIVARDLFSGDVKTSRPKGVLLLQLQILSSTSVLVFLPRRLNCSDGETEWFQAGLTQGPFNTYLVKLPNSKSFMVKMAFSGASLLTSVELSQINHPVFPLKEWVLQYCQCFRYKCEHHVDHHVDHRQERAPVYQGIVTLTLLKDPMNELKPNGESVVHVYNASLHSLALNLFLPYDVSPRFPWLATVGFHFFGNSRWRRPYPPIARSRDQLWHQQSNRQQH